MMRFIVALDAAMDPDKYRKEYLSKLRRMLSANVDQDVYGDMLDQFANYMFKLQGSQSEVAGILSPEAQRALKDIRTQTYQTLKKRSQTTQTPQRPQLTAPETQPDANWAVVRQRDGRPVYYFIRNTPEEAQTAFDILSMGDSWTYELVPVQPRSSFVPPRSLDILQGSTQDLQQRRSQGGFTGSWRITIDGEEVYRFSGVGNVQANANDVGQQWVLNAIRQGRLNPAPGAEIDVLPIMGDQS
jgi:hypothetical protein